MWWKNEESEQILNRGYLLKGESVEGAIERGVQQQHNVYISPS